MAYAAVISLKLTSLNNIQMTRSQRLELESLCKTLKTLDDERNRNIDRSAISALEAKIRDAAYNLEDAIQFHGLYGSPSPSDVQDLNRNFDLFFETAKKLKEDYYRVLCNPLLVEADVSLMHDFDGNDESATNGLSGQIEKITCELLDLEPGPKTVSLFGMAGIGKSHIARKVYQHPLVVQHFKSKAWVRVGQKRLLKDVLVDIVARIEGKPRTAYVGKNPYDLEVLFHNNLHGGRYLIVLDDVWSKDASDFLKDWLPGKGDGRRILLTTRLAEVAKYDGAVIQQMRFLNKEESWDLLWQNVFDDGDYIPPQLETVGRMIAEKCEGLPLLILAVARILRRLDKTEEFWKKVADGKTTTFQDAYEEIYEVLYSSYEYLRQHLKACFLYMGVFPQTSVITLPKLLNLWIAEDFFGTPIFEKYKLIDSDDYITLEKSAMTCLTELVSNSVVIICKHSSNFRIKSCKLHSVFWHLCTKEARKEKLFHVLKKLTDVSKEYLEGQRRLCIQNNILFGIEEAYNAMANTLTARSLLCTGPDHEYPVPICLDLMLLKVLDAAAIRFHEFPIEVLRLVRLKYLSLTHHGKLPCSISRLRQLQCLIVRHHHNVRILRDSDTIRLPKTMRDEIRAMHQVLSTKLLGDPTCLVKEIWEKICDIQEMFSDPSCLTKKLWMKLWRFAIGDDSERWYDLNVDWHTKTQIERLWSTKLLRTQLVSQRRCG